MALVFTTRVNKEQVENKEPKKGKEGKKRENGRKREKKWQLQAAAQYICIVKCSSSLRDVIMSI